MSKTKAKSYHHYIVAGMLLIKTEQEEGISQITLNSMVRSDIKNIPLRLVGKAQQALQVALHNRMQEDEGAPNYQVVDVVIINMIYCGHMTEEQFNATPGAELRERAAPVANDPFAAAPVIN